MTNYTLTVLDTSGIQDYIFGANNLKQNAGASYLADCATRDWVKVVLDQVAPNAHNVINFQHVYQPFDELQTIEKADVQAEVIYAGGGNTAILFKEFERAKAFAQQLSCKVIVEAPDLKLVIAHHRDFDWHNEVLGGKNGIVQRLMKKLREIKQGHPPAQPLRGLGVTVDCAFTHCPAVGYETFERDEVSRPFRPLSIESWAKLQATNAAEQRLLQFLNESIDSNIYLTPRDFEDIGSSHGESSYIAVVHADGNGMGKRLQVIQERFPNAAQNPDYVKAMRAFSLSVQRAAHRALNATVNYLTKQIKPSKEADKHQYLIYKVGQKLELKNDPKKGKPYLPFRPIVFGGDDVTFVCEGRLGLQLAAYYLKQFTAQELSEGGHAYCRAGVAITHTHYPFALAYELAENLCKSAKKSIKVWQTELNHQEAGITALDWHLAVNGMNEGLTETRCREYVGNVGSLLMRPLRLTEPKLDWRSWDQFSEILKVFQNKWLDQRNKLIGLREPLRRGPHAVQQYRQSYSLSELPPIADYRTMTTTGWQGKECGYFDALEALDFYGVLNDQSNESEAA